MSVITSLAKDAVLCLLSLLPVREDLVLLEGNRSYDDNTRALFEYLRSKPDLAGRYRFVWLMDDPDDFPFLNELGNVEARRIPNRHPAGVRDALAALSYVHLNCVARYCIYSNLFLGKRRRPGQSRVYLTHGTPLKNTVGMFGAAEEHDVVLAASDLAADWLRKSIPGSGSRVAVTGLPRNDRLVQGGDGSLCERFLPGSAQMRKILWMPTFKHQVTDRDRNDLSQKRSNDLQLLTADFMDRLNAKLVERGACLFVKFHPFQDLEFVDAYSLSNIVCLTKRDLVKKQVYLYSLISEFDALVTDYSSVAFDYLLLDRPIAYDLTDFEAYRDGIGFIVENPLDYMPGPKIRSPQDFLDFVDQVADGRDDWAARRGEVCGLMNAHRDDRSCERVLSHLGM